ncbi:HAD family hydrolase, partial [Pyxidicoccus sp. 3LG]
MSASRKSDTPRPLREADLSRRVRPLREADLARVVGVFTDVDGTLTTDHKLRADTVRALERLSAAGLRVVLVSGRP